MVQVILKVTVIFLLALVHAQGSEFLLESDPILEGKRVELNGDWWFEFGSHLSPNTLMTRIKQEDLKLVPTPANWHAFVTPDKTNPSLDGIATYATRLTFDHQPSVPLSITVPYVNDGYKVMWMPYDKPEQAIELGQSGDWQEGKRHSREDMLFVMPAEKDAVLFFYFAKALSFQGGIKEPITLQSNRAALDLHDLSNFSRSLMMGAILIMGIHYLIQYFHWRNNSSLILLSFICLVILIRSMGVSGMTALILSYVTPDHYSIRLRIEYLTIILAPMGFLHFFHSLVRNFFPNRLIKAVWGHTVIFTAITLLIPLDLMTKNLIIYQLHMLVLSALALSGLFWSAWKKIPFARLLLLGTTVLALGVLNDVYASMSEVYHIYLIEFFVFFFLIFQAQVVGIKLNETVNLSTRLKAEKLKLERKHDQIVLDSQLDHLTGLYNRKAFEDLFSLTWQHALISQETLSIVLLDLDHFKKINDTHGHLIGDEVLIYIASLLRSQNLRKGDFICRYGGEEFVLILPETELEDAYHIAEKLRQAIAHAPVYEDDEISLHLTTSIGVYATTPSEDNYKDALGKADEALYKAKNSGRNCVISQVD